MLLHEGSSVPNPSKHSSQNTIKEALKAMSTSVVAVCVLSYNSSLIPKLVIMKIIKPMPQTQVNESTSQQVNKSTSP